eukprot:15478620-Alexandrium_andersonii.AAC.1
MPPAASAIAHVCGPPGSLASALGDVGGHQGPGVAADELATSWDPTYGLGTAHADALSPNRHGG